MDKFIFTAKGLEYAAKTATGSVLMFTKGKFGSGTTSGDVANLTNLINPLGELQISKKTVTENQVTIETQFTNTVSDSATLPPFHLTEIGLFAKLQTSGGADDSQYPETLVCYAHATGSDAGDYIPSTPTEFIINWPFSVSNADNVQITVGLGAFALQRDLDSEAAARAEAEKTLQKNIDNEKTAREQGDSDAKTYAETAIRTAIDALVNGAPDAMDTLKELADAMKENKDALEALREIASSKVNSSDFTAHKEKIASITELGHVKLYNRSGVNASGILIYDDGSIVVNVDNRHGLYRSGAGQVMIAAASEEEIAAKTDEYKPLVPARLGYIFENTALTGTPTSPTADVGTNSTQIATTAFVQNEIREVLSKSAILAPAKITCQVERITGSHGSMELSYDIKFEDTYGNDVSLMYGDYAGAEYGEGASAFSWTELKQPQGRTKIKMRQEAVVKAKEQMTAAQSETPTKKTKEEYLNINQ